MEIDILIRDGGTIESQNSLSHCSADTCGYASISDNSSGISPLDPSKQSVESECEARDRSSIIPEISPNLSKWIQF